MEQYPGATIPAICNDCKRPYLISKPEYDTPVSVCKECFDAFDGLTIEQIIGKDSPTKFEFCPHELPIESCNECTYKQYAEYYRAILEKIKDGWETPASIAELALQWEIQDLPSPWSEE